MNEMATKPETVEKILDSLKGLDVHARKMFGEYAIYCGTKLPALVADDELFLKITPFSRAQFDESHDAPPYPGAKMYIRVPESKWTDSNLMLALFQGVSSELPEPRLKK